jgi:hypothetical protein
MAAAVSMAMNMKLNTAAERVQAPRSEGEPPLSATEANELSAKGRLVRDVLLSLLLF